jgi:hypothetical protein
MTTTTSLINTCKILRIYHHSGANYKQQIAEITLLEMVDANCPEGFSDQGH